MQHQLARQGRRVLGATSILGGVAGLGLLAYAGLIEKNAFTVRHERLQLLPPGAKAIRILQLSDIHLVTSQERKKRWLRSLAQLTPDFVINTGDNLSDPQAVPELLSALEPLLEVPGAFVPGSNDYYAPVLKNPFSYFSGPSSQRKAAKPLQENPWQPMFSAFENAGWANLTNRASDVEIRGTAVGLTGVDDPHIKREQVQAFASADTAVRIGITHAPYTRVLEKFAELGADLSVAGHTHGGQVCVPFYGALVSNCDLPPRQASGLSEWAGVPLQVSAGIGTSRFAPVRLACRPEAVVLELLPRDD